MKLSMNSIVLATHQTFLSFMQPLMICYAVIFHGRFQILKQRTVTISSVNLIGSLKLSKRSLKSLATQQSEKYHVKRVVFI